MIKKLEKQEEFFFPLTSTNEMAKDYKKSILDDAIRTFDENPATLDGIETINKGLS